MKEVLIEILDLLILLSDLSDLKYQQAEFVKQQNYEEATKIRTKLQELEKLLPTTDRLKELKEKLNAV